MLYILCTTISTTIVRQSRRLWGTHISTWTEYLIHYDDVRHPVNNECRLVLYYHWHIIIPRDYLSTGAWRVILYCYIRVVNYMGVYKCTAYIYYIILCTLLEKPQFLTTKYSRYPSYFYEHQYIPHYIQYHSVYYKKTFFGK